MCVPGMLAIYPFDEWPSFNWEGPLFRWFLGFAIILGVVLAMVLSVIHRKSGFTDLLSIADAKD